MQTSLDDLARLDTAEQRVLGIDPGLNTTGYGLVSLRHGRVQLLEGGAIRLPDRRTPLERRLLVLHRDMTDLMREARPAVVAIEDVYSRYERPRTAILMGHARGVIVLVAGQAGVPVRAFTASAVKRVLTGGGAAKKPQVQRAVAEILGLSAIPEPPDVADALAIALTCVNHLRARV
ncbi:MAG: crossover junction endodeoxyribonuclease RuvC [Dehalococcoidia bacterium]|nr:crossover junction endodeoxyribonuclease RuvC [Dehalococcoidia bacterium]